MKEMKGYCHDYPAINSLDERIASSRCLQTRPPSHSGQPDSLPAYQW
jgi:hypothetical protein